MSVENDKLVLKTAEKVVKYPMEDINCVLIDNSKINVSIYALNRLCESGATVLVCDGKHLPATVVLPFNSYYKKMNVLKEQFSLSKPKIKRLWQSIVRQKIKVQAECLEMNGKKEQAEYLYALSRSVLSGDSENVEARSASYYFKALFGKSFTREENHPINACLNYGYSIVRSLICRHLSARGFECSLGVFHKNQFNNFNLADDMIEPFRPIIDNYIFSLNKENLTLSPEIKRKLFSIVNLDVLSGGERHSLSNAVERQVESLLSVYSDKKEELVFPSLCKINMHEYE
ncbi:MAG: type II CRISPR-associated endonuclease Cas1 [Clostridia bacterium]|nr:type II CRISPR-associated endonuclease Cas1 [Clostridia bacterium]